MQASAIMRSLAADGEKKLARGLARAARARAAAPSTPAPVKTEEQREELPVHPDAQVERVETKAVKAVVLDRTPDAVSALITLFPPGMPDVVDPDEDEATRAMRQLFDVDPKSKTYGKYTPHAARAIDVKDPNRWLPANPRLSAVECYQAAKRAQAEAARVYGPEIARRARVETVGGQRAERTLVGRLSALHLAAPDERERSIQADAGIVRPRGWKPVRMEQARRLDA